MRPHAAHLLGVGCLQVTFLSNQPMCALQRRKERKWQKQRKAITSRFPRGNDPTGLEWWGGSCAREMRIQFVTFVDVLRYINIQCQDMVLFRNSVMSH